MEGSFRFYKQDVEPESLWLNKEYLVQLNLTGTCPLRCDFCYIKNQQNTNLTPEQIERLWSNLRKYYLSHGIKYRVNLTGGDIFYSPYWKEIANFIAREESIESVDPLINRFWTEEQKELLTILRDKINFVQFNADVVRDEDIQSIQDIGKRVVLKISLYEGVYKRNLKKLQGFVDKFDNVIISIDVIIPQKVSCLEKQKYIFDNIEKLRNEIIEIKKIFGKRLWVLSATLKRELLHEIYYCPVPFGGTYVMPDGKVVPCSRYSHLDTGFTTENFDLLSYIRKYSRLTSNYCLHENKYFTDFWKKEENPAVFVAGLHNGDS